MKRKQIIVVTAVVLVIIVVFIWLVDWVTVGQVLSTAVTSWLIIGTIALFAGWVAYAARWRQLLGNKPTLSFTFHTANIGHAFNIWLPARAGEALRIVIMGQRDDLSYTEATTSFAVERVFEQLMRLVAFGGALVFGLSGTVSWQSMVGGIAFLLLMFGIVAWLLNHQETTIKKGSRLVARLPRITEETAQNWLTDLLNSLSVVTQRRPFLLVLAWSLLTWGCMAVFHYATLRALGSSFPPDKWLAITFASLALSPPSAPTQPGLYHAIVVAPLTAVDLDPDLTTAYAILLHLQQMVGATLLAGFGIWQLKLSPRTLWQNIRGE